MPTTYRRKIIGVHSCYFAVKSKPFAAENLIEASRKVCAVTPRTSLHEKPALVYARAGRRLCIDESSAA